MITTQRRVPAGTPTGGRFAACARPEAEVSLDPSGPNPRDGSAQGTAEPLPGTVTPEAVVVIGEGLGRIPIAQVRRDLPVGQRVQVVYPGEAGGEPDVRVVASQETSHMWTDRPGQPGHMRLDWAGLTAEKDSSGVITVYGSGKAPIATFIPLGVGEPGYRDLDDRNPTTVAIGRARTSTDPAELVELAGSYSGTVRHLVAANRATPDEALARLARGADESLARDILRREYLPRAVIWELADHPAESVRRDVAHHRSADAAVLDVMADRYEECQVLVAENRNTSRDTLHRIAETGTHMARVTAAGNPSTDYQDLDRLAATGSAWAKEAVAGNPSTPEYVLRRLHRDPKAESGVLSALVRNPSTPKDVVANIMSRSSRDTVVHADAAGGPHSGVRPVVDDERAPSATGRLEPRRQSLAGEV